MVTRYEMLVSYQKIKYGTHILFNGGKSSLRRKTTLQSFTPPMLSWKLLEIQKFLRQIFFTLYVN